MRIRTQFMISMLLFGIILVILAASVMVTEQKMKKTGQQENLAASIARGANELSYLSNDYLIYRENQQQKRWQSRYASLSSQVASLDVDEPEQQTLARNIKTNEQRLKQVFDSVASGVGGSSQNRSTALDLAFLQVSWSRMAVQSQAMVSDASRLSRLLDQQVDQITQIRAVLMYAMVGVLSLFFLSSYLMTYRRILKSIATLQAGTTVIASGNLDFSIEEKKKDEIGDLAHAFNQMTASLKEMTASKTELEKEILERKRAQEALSEALDRAAWLARFPEQNPNPVIRASADGTILYCNPASIEAHGWKCEVGQPLPLPLQLTVGQAMAEKRDVEQDVELGERVYSVSALPFPEEGYANVYGRDITERKRAEEALRKSEARYRSYIEVTEQLGWTTNADGEVVEDIPSWRRFTDQSEEEVKGWGWSKALHPDDLEHTAEVWRKAVATRNKYEVEYRIRRYDGVYRDFLARGVPISNDDGNVREWVGTCIDITERKQSEKALRQRTLELQQLTETLEKRVEERTKELGGANEALRQLSVRLLAAHEEERKKVAGELHDTIGSCLTGIKFKVESAREEMNKTPEAAVESLDAIVPVIREAVEECRRIQMDLRPSILDDLGLLPTLSWFFRGFQTIYSTIHVEQEMRIEESELPDSLKIIIYRVIQEAMNNIAKHSKADLAHISLRKDHNKVELTVTDNGQGFNAQERFPLKDSGRGLGLTSMRERTELSGGSFAIESVKGKGTSIHASWTV